MPETKEIQSGLSDDLSEFTVIKEEEGLESVDGTEVDEVKEDDEEEFFDIESIPEDQKEAFSETYGKMKTALKDKLSKISDVQGQAALANDLVKRLEAIPSQPHKVAPEIKPDDVLEKDAFKFKFEEGDYYKPAFDELAGLVGNINKSIQGLTTGYLQDKATDFQKGVKSFFVSNKVGADVVRRMDEIANEYGRDASGKFVMHKDLPRLLKLAKLELGIKDTPTTKKVVNIKGQVESKTRRKGQVQEKPAETMREAWDQAAQQLSEK